MVREYPNLRELKREFGTNKVIPQKYEEVILKALSHFPELKETHIEVKLKKVHSVPYSTAPSVSSLLKMNAKYVISLLEESEAPTEQALFRNLPVPAQIGVIGHELGHVIQYLSGSTATALKRVITGSKGATKRLIERGADIIAIEHGLGFELYTLAVFIRSIPGYIEHRKDLEVCYLHPHEILEALPPEQLQDIKAAS